VLGKTTNLKYTIPYFNILFYLKNLNWFKHFNPNLFFTSLEFFNVSKKNLLNPINCLKKRKFFHFQFFSKKNLSSKKRVLSKYRYRLIFKPFFYTLTSFLNKSKFKMVGPPFTKKTFCYINNVKNNRLVSGNPTRIVRKRFFYKFKILKLRFFVKNLLITQKTKNLKILSNQQKLKLKKTIKPINIKPYLYLQKKQKHISKKLSLLQTFFFKTKSFYSAIYNKKKNFIKQKIVLLVIGLKHI